jgi:2,5-diketo-D-gluconate reductase B
MVAQLPELGLGTSNLGIKFGDDHDGPDDPDECVDAVAAALDIGYRHIDTAQMYQNEHLVGEALQRSAVDREEVFLATKVHPSNLGFDDVIESTKESLSKLRTDYVDLLYVHWPIKAYEPEKTLPAFDRLYDEGYTDYVGVSNFTVETLERAREVLDAPIAVNQIQVHPLLPPTEAERAAVRPYADDHDIDIVAWSPLARGEALSLAPIQEVAEKHGVSPARVILAWLYEYDLKLIVKASSRDHLRDNFAARSLELDAADVEKIESIRDRTRLFDREGAPWNQ